MTAVERRPSARLVLFRLYVLILAAPTSAAVGLSLRGAGGAAVAILLLAFALTCGAAVERWFLT